MSTGRKERKGDNIAFVLPPPRTARAAGTDAAVDAPAAPAASAPLVASERPPIVPPLAPAVARPKTGPGLTTMEILDNATLRQKVSELEQEIQRLAGERGALLLDAREIAQSRWANRHADSFRGPDFEAFKSEIMDAGGNVQPIMVRPLEGKAGEGAHKYEVVFGHRRHRACLELGLPVLAVVQDLQDRDLFIHMERENRGRQSLSAWEQGRMYLRALDEGLFPSNTQLANAIGRSVSDIGKAVRIAQLPSEVVGAFPSPNAIQFRWASDLQRALETDADAVLAAARAADQLEPRPSAAEVQAALTACLRDKGVGRSYPPVHEIDLGQGRSATLRTDAKGRTVIEFSAGVLNVEQWPALEAALRKLTG